MKTLCAILLGLVLVERSYSQTEISRAGLVDNLSQLIERYRNKSISIRYSASVSDGKKTTTSKSVLTVTDRYGFIYSEGTRTLAMGFNEDYAFQVVRKNKNENWLVRDVASKSNDCSDQEAEPTKGWHNKN